MTFYGGLGINSYGAGHTYCSRKRFLTRSEYFSSNFGATKGMKRKRELPQSIRRKLYLSVVSAV